MGVQRDIISPCPIDCSSSVSSTVTVERPQPKALQAIRVKCVSFDIDANVFHENIIISREDCVELWYTSSDYKIFRRNTMGMAKSIMQAESQNKAPFSYERVIERVYEISKSAVVDHETFLHVSTPSDRKHLQRWITAAPSRIGMEKWTARTVSKERQIRRFELIELLLDIQQSPPVGTNLDEIIRKSCESISRPSRLFAQAMGQAGFDSSMQDHQ